MVRAGRSRKRKEIKESSVGKDVEKLEPSLEGKMVQPRGIQTDRLVTETCQRALLMLTCVGMEQEWVQVLHDYFLKLNFYDNNLVILSHGFSY